jgi:hypothetical protein
MDLRRHSNVGMEPRRLFAYNKGFAFRRAFCCCSRACMRRCSQGIILLFLVLFYYSIENIVDIFYTADSCKQFVRSRQAYSDERCFPSSTMHYLTGELNETINLATSLSTLEPMNNQFWRQDPIDWDHDMGAFKYEPAKVKTFTNAYVYRWASTTYIKGKSFWMACERCLIPGPTRAIRPPFSFSLRFTYDEAVLTSSQIWVSGNKCW